MGGMLVSFARAGYMSRYFPLRGGGSRTHVILGLGRIPLAPKSDNWRQKGNPTVFPHI